MSDGLLNNTWDRQPRWRKILKAGLMVRQLWICLPLAGCADAHLNAKPVTPTFLLNPSRRLRAASDCSWWGMPLLLATCAKRSRVISAGYVEAASQAAFEPGCVKTF